MFANITENDRCRNEYKYIISTNQMFFLQSIIKKLLPIDKHINGTEYKVKSLYFDNYDNKCFYDNENGVEPRQKFRIRVYNDKYDKIKLEIKRKEHSQIIKYWTSINIEQAQELINGKNIIGADNDEILKYVQTKIKTELYHPVSVVEYNRTAYESKDIIRITFDKNITSSTYVNAFFDAKMPRRPILPLGMNIMEVKFRQIKPKYIFDALQFDNLNLTKFSKYYFSRCYSI